MSYWDSSLCFLKLCFDMLLCTPHRALKYYSANTRSSSLCSGESNTVNKNDSSKCKYSSCHSELQQWSSPWWPNSLSQGTRSSKQMRRISLCIHRDSIAVIINLLVYVIYSNWITNGLYQQDSYVFISPPKASREHFVSIVPYHFNYLHFVRCKSVESTM